MPICIAGMHRSGTSMVTRLLHGCGLFLGPEKELGVDSNNGEPHWENVGLVALNDRILNRLGGSWDNPPDFPPGWECEPEIDVLTSEAKKQLKRVRGGRYWGWKDPRNSLTLPFWLRLIPDLMTVICLRNPLEVSHSINRRGDLLGVPLFSLWLTYYRELLASIPPQRRVVTHYQSYFHNPTAEIQRVTNAIGMKASTDKILSAATCISVDLRHHQANTSELTALNLPNEVLELYQELCRESGSIDTH